MPVWVAWTEQSLRAITLKLPGSRVRPSLELALEAIVGCRIRPAGLHIEQGSSSQ
jgi:hypothetical protein